MTNKLLFAVLAALSLPACLDAEPDPITQADEDPTTDVETNAGATMITPTRASAERRTVDVCSQLPTDDSACAHACDPDVLISFVPEGTCATFSCTLTSGAEYITGACNF